MMSNGVNIYIVGAQSTGKSTVAMALMNYFETLSTNAALCVHSTPPRIISEVAREVMYRHDLRTDDTFSSPGKALRLQRLILDAQQEAERIPGWFISDRSGLDPMVYARVHGGGVESALSMEASETGQKLLENMRKALVLVCEPNTEWLVDDGTRYMPESIELWESFHQLYCSELQRLDIPYKILPAHETDITRRVSLAIQWWCQRRDSSVKDILEQGSRAQ